MFLTERNLGYASKILFSLLFIQLISAWLFGFWECYSLQARLIAINIWAFFASSWSVGLVRALPKAHKRSRLLVGYEIFVFCVLVVGITTMLILFFMTDNVFNS